MIILALATLLSGQDALPERSDPPFVSGSPARIDDNRPWPSEGFTTDPASVAQMQVFGACVARHRPEQAAALIRLDFNERDFKFSARKLAFSERGCQGKTIKSRFSPVLFAGAAAEEMLPKTGNLSNALTYHPASPPIKALSESDYVATCVVRKATNNVVDLLATTVNSRAEIAVIKQLTPVVEQCVAAGQRARFNRPALRATLATAAYRIVRAERGVQSPAKYQFP